MRYGKERGLNTYPSTSCLLCFICIETGTPHTCVRVARFAATTITRNKLIFLFPFFFKL